MIAATVACGPSSWEDWATKTHIHSGVYFTNHIGFQKLATYSSEVAGQDFRGASGAILFGTWNRMLAHRWDRGRPLNITYMLLHCLIILVLCTRLRPDEASLFAGTGLLFFASMPSNYYYVFLAIYGSILVANAQNTHRTLPLAGLLAILVCTGYAAVDLSDEYVRSLVASLAIHSFLTLACACYAYPVLRRWLFVHQVRELLPFGHWPAQWLRYAALCLRFTHAALNPLPRPFFRNSTATDGGSSTE